MGKKRPRIKAFKRIIGYYGGKAKMAKHIIPLIPDHLLYAEPFAGSAAILFSKPIPENTPNSKYIERINDQNDQLMNMYVQAKTKPDDFLKQVKALPFSKKIFDYCSDICRGLHSVSQLKRATAFYVMINAGFANIPFGGWRRSQMANEANRYMNNIDSLDHTLTRMRNVALDCESWKTFLIRANSPHSFAYVDPPYADTTQEYDRGYKNDKLSTFTNQDYQELIDYLDKEWVGSFIMSNYPNDNVEIPKAWSVVEKQQYMCATQIGKTFKKAEHRGKTKADFSNNKRTEVLYIRDSVNDVSKEVQKYYDRMSEFRKLPIIKYLEEIDERS
ncbi:MAG: hypothetical protein DRI84_07645 [Bacteroidetes bacterium]|nr:MAG: hypothetical protein DRI84_07645 [Bacteroidota bacterium]